MLENSGSLRPTIRHIVFSFTKSESSSTSNKEDTKTFLTPCWTKNDFFFVCAWSGGHRLLRKQQSKNMANNWRCWNQRSSNAFSFLLWEKTHHWATFEIRGFSGKKKRRARFPYVAVRFIWKLLTKNSANSRSAHMSTQSRLIWQIFKVRHKIRAERAFSCH